MLNKTLHQLFEDQVAKYPDKIALISNQAQLTYNTLNIKANQLAHYLHSNYSIGSEKLVCLYLNRDENLIISILAILKLGAAYVPIDLDCPM